MLTKHDEAFVYAGVREPEKATALKELKSKYPGKLAIVKLISGDVEGNTIVAKEIELRHGRVDTVVANAGKLPESTQMIYETHAS